MLRIAFQAAPPVIVIMGCPQHIAAAQYIDLGTGQFASCGQVRPCRRGKGRWYAGHGTAVVIIDTQGGGYTGGGPGHVVVAVAGSGRAFPQIGTDAVQRTLQAGLADGGTAVVPYPGPRHALLSVVLGKYPLFGKALQAVLGSYGQVHHIINSVLKAFAGQAFGFGAAPLVIPVLVAQVIQ